MYFASDLDFGAACPDDGEFLSVEPVALSELEAMIGAGRMTDAKTICIYSMAKARGLI